MLIDYSLIYHLRLESLGWKHLIKGQLQRIIEHARDQNFQKRAGLFKARVRVHFDQPRLQGRVDYEVVTEYLHAELSILRIQSSIDTPQSVLDYLKYGLVHQLIQIACNPILFQKFGPFLQRQLISFFKCPIIFVELLDRIIREVDEGFV